MILMLYCYTLNARVCIHFCISVFIKLHARPFSSLVGLCICIYLCENIDMYTVAYCINVVMLMSYYVALYTHLYCLLNVLYVLFC